MTASHVVDLATVNSQQQIVGDSLHPVTSVEVTVLLDNTVDMLLPSTVVVRRPPLLPDAFDWPALRAEHGYSALITIDGGPSVLYDAGISKDGAARNLSVLEVATGAEVRLPPPSQADLAAEGVEVVEERGPSLLLDGHLLI
ncbi:MAG: hypothetical protein ACRDSN_08515, partial [Pseudonocardiaceae bacterium]